MKPIYTLLLTACLLTLAACGGEDERTTGSTTGQTQDEAIQASPLENVAICLWDQAGLRSIAGRGGDAKYLATINFGEVVTLTGNTEQPEGEKYPYLEMELSDGKKGWSSSYLFAAKAERAAALGKVDVYNRPDLTTYKGKQFERGDIFAVVASDKPGWAEAFGKEKAVSGWIKVDPSAYSTDEVDVTAAILIDRALQISDPLKQKEELQKLAENSTFGGSAFMSLIAEKLQGIEPIPDLPANQLYVVADKVNVRSAPDNEADNVVFQLERGNICNILERGARQTIRDMDDYWYRIEKDGEEGWIYGFFTSKRREE
ncbi:MAG: hypothetical protein OHK0039_00340 [Bacteroidia bacterium]